MQHGKRLSARENVFYITQDAHIRKTEGTLSCHKKKPQKKIVPPTSKMLTFPREVPACLPACETERNILTYSKNAAMYPAVTTREKSIARKLQT